MFFRFIRPLKFFLLLALITLASMDLHAQVFGVPLQEIPQQARRFEYTRNQNISRRTTPRDPKNPDAVGAAPILVNLPFFDDFSTTTVKPDSTRWYSESGQFGTYINNVFGDNPPTVNVATFDGIGAGGFPYNTNPRAVGQADTLTSQGIRLAGQPSGNLYLSFFLMPGNREIESRPDSADSLVVQFLLPNNTYRSVGKFKGAVEPRYHFRALQVPPECFFDGFRFKFISYGRLNGAYDVWNLDYVRLEQGFPDSSALDVAMSSQPGPLFKDFRSISLDHFMHDRDRIQFSDTTFSAITNLNADIINFNLQFFANQYVGSGLGREFLFVPTGEDHIIGTGRPLLTGETREVKLVPTEATRLTLPPDAQPMDFTSRYALVRDPSFNAVASNDTVTSIASLRDFYAYDDGGHEKAYYVAGNGARLLYKYTPFVGDTLIGITFGIDTRTFNYNTAVPFNIIIYSKIKGVDGATNDVVAYRDQGFLIGFSSQNTNLVYFATDSGINVPGPFYIGYQQGIGVENTVYVQADINSVAKNAFYFSTTAGEWNAYTSSRNALIIRPHFTCTRCPVAIKKRLAILDFEVYPNPGRAGKRLRIEGKLESASLLSPDGRILAEYTARRGETLSEVTLPGGIAAGVYTLKGSGKDGAFGAKRVLVQ